LRAIANVSSSASVLGGQTALNLGQLTIPLKNALVKEVVWNGVLFPQVPSMIFIVYQKDVAAMLHDTLNFAGADPGAALAALNYDYTAGGVNTLSTAALANTALANTGAACDINRRTAGRIAARGLALNRDTNAAIMGIEIVIQSAVGSFAFKDSSYPYLEDRDLLWRKHARNCHNKYCPSGRAIWQEKESCALLSSSDFCLGLGTSPGAVFPITMDIRVRFANKSFAVGGEQFSGLFAKGQQALPDIIVGQPILVGQFNNHMFNIAASSGVLSSQAFSQSTVAATLASG